MSILLSVSLSYLIPLIHTSIVKCKPTSSHYECVRLNMHNIYVMFFLFLFFSQSNKRLEGLDHLLFYSLS